MEGVTKPSVKLMTMAGGATAALLWAVYHYAPLTRLGPRGGDASADREPPSPAPAASPQPPANGKPPVGTTAKPPPLAPVPDGFSPTDTARMRQIYGRFATGDFIGALSLADADLSGPAGSGGGDADSYRSWVLGQLPALLAASGWSHLKLGDCDSAINDLTRAEAIQHSIEVVKGLAICFYKQKNYLAARDQLRLYREKVPGDTTMELIYSDVLESEGNFDEAVKILEILAAAPPVAGQGEPTAAGSNRQILGERLLAMRGRAKESQMQQSEQSVNFRLVFRGGDHEDLVAFVLATLEEAYDEYLTTYGFKPLSSPLEVALYPATAFTKVAGGPAWAEGLFDGRLRIPVRPEAVGTSGRGDLAVVLRHELVHGLFARMSDSRPLPPWFDEGMAQLLACTGYACGIFAFGPAPGSLLPAPSFQTPYISLPAIHASHAYRQSLYLVLALANRYGTDGLRASIGRIASNSDLSSDSLLAPLGLTFADLHREAAADWQAQRLPRRQLP